MAKCQKCGFLAVWNTRLIGATFEEAPEFFRYNGRQQVLIKDRWPENEPRCFIQKAALPLEVTLLIDIGGEWAPSVLNIIEKERACSGFTEWKPGYDPKEHREMLDRDAMLADQRWHANISLTVAVGAALATAVGIGVGAYFNMRSAQIQADAQVRSAQMQIDSQKELSRSVPPINVTIQIPENKKSKVAKP